MPNRKKIKILDPIKKPYDALLFQYSSENACLDAIFYARARKETNGCYRCGGNIHDLYSKLNGRKGYQCKNCLYQVYPMSGTVLDHMHLNLKEFFAITIDKIVNHSGVTGNSITYKYSFGNGTGAKAMERVLMWMFEANKMVKITAPRIEIDESGINTGTKGLGRKRKKSRGFGSDSITPCLTIMERNGNVKSFVVPNREADTILPIITDNVNPNTIIYTDEFKGYNKLTSLGYEHKQINHSKKEWKNEDICTNTTEGYFGRMKPNIKGTYRQISEKNLHLYLAEHDFRYNNRRVSLSQRFEKLLDSFPPLFEHIRLKEVEKTSDEKNVA